MKALTNINEIYEVGFRGDFDEYVIYLDSLLTSIVGNTQKGSISLVGDDIKVKHKNIVIPFKHCDLLSKESLSLLNRAGYLTSKENLSLKISWDKIKTDSGSSENYKGIDRFIKSQKVVCAEDIVKLSHSILSSVDASKILKNKGCTYKRLNNRRLWITPYGLSCGIFQNSPRKHLLQHLSGVRLDYYGDNKKYETRL